MTPKQLKNEYLENISKMDIPEEFSDILEELQNFTVFPQNRMADIILSDDDQEILFNLGLPSEHKTGIIFDKSYLERGIKNQIGCSDSGDPVCLKQDGQLVCYNHDNDMEEVFINSSIHSYMKCAVALQENDESDLSLVDPALKAHIPNYWHSNRKLQD